jgi:hypothetical protein
MIMLQGISFFLLWINSINLPICICPEKKGIRPAEFHRSVLAVLRGGKVVQSLLPNLKTEGIGMRFR